MLRVAPWMSFVRAPTDHAIETGTGRAPRAPRHPCRTADSWRQSSSEGAFMQIPVRTPEGEPLRCPLCGNVAVLEVSITCRDATCPGCGFLLWSVRDRTQLRDLVRKAKGGDSDALHRFFQRVRRSVRARMTSRQRARTDSDDILQ